MRGRIGARVVVAMLAALLVVPVAPAPPVRAAEATTTVVVASANPSTYGQGVTFTATVTAGVGTPTGSVQFTVDGANLGTAVTLSGGTATSIAVTTLTVGTHPVTALYASDDLVNYADSTGTLAGGQSVDPATLTVTPDPQAVTYGAAEPAYTFGISGFVLGEDQGTAAGFGAPACDSDYTPTTPVASSPRTISCSGGSASNYDFSYGTADLTISKASQVITFTSTPPAAATVGGPGYTPTATAGSGDPVVFTIDGASASVCTIGAGVVSFTGPGTCTIDANEDGNANWNPAPQAQQSFGVGQASTTTSVGSSGSPTTYGTSVTFSVTVTPPAATGTVTIKDGVTTLGTCSLAGGACTYVTGALDAGSHSITAVYGGSGGYLGSTSTPIIQAVDPKPLTVTGITASSKVYDGTTAAALNTAGAALIGVVGGDTVTLGTGAATGTFASKAVGNGKTVTVSGLTLGGADSGNYSLVQPAATANITARSLTVTATGVDKVYDGTTAATVTLSDDRVAGDVLGTAYASASFVSNAKVGTAKSVSVTGISVSGGADAANYTLANTTATTTANITERPLTVTISASNKVYDGTTAASVTAGDNRVSGDNITPHVGTASFDTKSVGTAKTVTGSGLSLTGPDSSNYTLANTTATTTANITARSLAVTATGVSRPYDGTTSATVTLSDNRVAGDVLTTTYAAASFATPGVGTAKPVTVTGISISGGADAANYTLANTTAATTASITAASVTPSITASDKVYTGTTAATATCALSGVLPADVGNVTCSGSAAFADKNVGTGKTVTMTGITLAGSASANYGLSATTAVTTATITARSLTVTATGVNKVYDGTTAASVTLSDNRVAGDVLSATATSASFLDKTVGTGKLVNVAGISISGADAGNYTLANTTAVTAANITRATLTVAATGVSRVYDGTTTATVTLDDNRVAGDVLTRAYTTASFATKGVGSAKSVSVSGISISGGADAANYTLANTTATTAAITKRPISVTAVTSTKVYDGTTSSTGVPTLTGGTLAAGDTATWTQAFATKAVGTDKTLTPAGAVADGNGGANYDVTFVPDATGVITPKTLTVTGVTASSRPYDATTSATLATGSAALVGRVGGDTVTLVTTGATGTFADKNVGVGKAVAVSGLTISGADAPNYTLTQPTTTASITKAPLTVSADATSRPYGDANPPLTVSYAGFVGGETLGTSGVTGSPTCSTAALATSGVGQYPITCSLGSLASANYGITVAPGGSLTVTRAPLTLTADDQSRQYGLPNPPLTATVSGYVLGETATTADLTGAPSCTTPAVATDSVGTQPITCTAGTLAADNYLVTTLVPGTMAITPALAAPLVSADVNPAAPTVDVTFAAAVSWPTGTPTGTVTFYEGATDLSGPLSLVAGRVELHLSWPEAGVHDLTAVYSGDGANFGEAAAAPFRLVVGKSDVIVSVTTNRATWETNVPITFTATLVPSASGVTQALSGSVAFRVDGAVKASVPVAAETAAYTTTLGAGSHSVIAEFTPDLAGSNVFNAGASSPLARTVVANTVAATSVGRSSGKVFPVKDGWKDTVTIRGTRLEKASVTITIYSPRGAKVRTKTRAAASGAYSWAWNGRSSSGRILPAGKYRIVQVLRDAYGARATYTSYVRIVTKRMYWYTKTITVSPGPRNYQVRSTGDTSVLTAPSTRSTKPVVMSNATAGKLDWIAAGYQFTLPSASTFRSLSFRVKGSWTGTTAPKIGLVPWSGGDWFTSIYSLTRARASMGTSPTAYYRQTLTSLGGIRSGRSVRAVIDSFDATTGSGYSAGAYRYSITAVKLVVRYGILR